MYLRIDRAEVAGRSMACPARSTEGQEITRGAKECLYWKASPREVGASEAVWCIRELQDFL